MAVSIGNLAMVFDAVVSVSRIAAADRKLARPVVVGDGVAVNASLPKRDFYQIIANTYAAIGMKRFDSEERGRRKRERVAGRGRRRSKTNWIDFAESSDEEGYESGYEEEEEEDDWDEEMRKRMKEMEERRELEKKAEDLQSRLVENGEESVEESEEEKRMRVKRELEKVAKEQEERRATAKLMFDIGQKAYGRGMYGRAIEFFEGALTIIPRSTVFGGEIQIWLAMAYEANNRHGDCIALYRSLEAQHPSFSIRRQASELRYILQAPKLKISQDEMVTIPLIGSSYDSYAATWSDKNKDIDKKKSDTVTSELPSTKNYLADFHPPEGFEKSQAFWATITLWFCLISAAFLLQ
uniref:Uncharacterized protein n=1 Tax=Kalanchoe fedtschenkoi TaxID=63787 RepID=A0A7N0TEX6_KALFE